MGDDQPANELEALVNSPFLAGIRQEVLAKLVEAAIERRFEPGESILLEGDLGRTIMVVTEGQVEVVKGKGGEEMVLSQRGPGEVFGEMAFFEAQPRFATVRAITLVRVLEVSEARLRDALSEQPELLFHTTQIVSARLRNAQQQMIADLQQKNLELRQAYLELKQAQADLIVKERLEREMELAHEIQQNFLQSEFPRRPGFDCAARSRPARQVGGDFYDVIPLSDKRVGLVMADVSDKGMPAALFMALSRSLIRAEARRSISPRQVLLTVNHLLQEMSQADMFVTVFYGVLDLRKGNFDYVRAGHDRPLIYRASDNDCCFLTARGIMLGMFEDIELEEIHEELCPGDRLVLYTDGVTDANSPSGEFFGAERLQEIVCQAHELGPKALCDLIFQRLDDFQNGATQYDDIAVLIAQLESV
jgi:phosphoserine phosphatase RsbU/P